MSVGNRFSLVLHHYSAWLSLLNRDKFAKVKVYIMLINYSEL